MITVDNLPTLLVSLDFVKVKNTYSKTFANEVELKVDFDKKQLIYPEDKGLKINERQTCNFSSNENFVVFECVHRLLEKGYHPESIELEPKWKLGHGASGGRADILVKDRNNTPLLIIECKTPGTEYAKALKYTLFDGAQLFSYAQQIPATQFLCLYASNFTDKKELSRDYFVIPHKDNAKILEQDKQSKSFKEAQNVQQRFEVWKNTYQLEPLTQVIFEDSNQAYIIGKDKYTLDDLKPISKSDAEDKTNTGKYHHFRTILRKYNVARRENAFEVLVNLFLCKLVDETKNPHDLKFYWKGIAYDSYFDLVDRLQSLYKTGMDDFLDQDITYISNDEIDKAFWTVRNNKNATKQKIKDIFTQLKFYKGLDFDFIKVHNKELFDKNAKILIEIVQMWQDARLKTEEQNQFLGDMFEYFLDNGIKQSEGQFFTPIPVCRFILMAIPLEELVKESEYPPKMIDYACGAGHFLNEYAAQITPHVLTHKPQTLKTHYANIDGIEKEDRLAKVAKVSAFMYGQDEINIIDADALAPHSEIKNNSYNLLVANPPFAVEGFLETLSEEQREDYDLLNTVSDVVSNRNIQCFFLERAKQLLAPKGMTGIIVPSSVLSNSDATHIATREQLLQNFDIVAIVELGSGTFGKTGTNTVVLFLRRKHKQPTEAEHYRNRVEDWFNQDEEAAVYNDAHLIKHYCEQLELDFTAYQSLLQGEPSAELLATELFTDYRKAFEKSTEFKSTTIKYKKQQSNLAKTLTAQLNKQQKDKKDKRTAKEIQQQVQALIPEEKAKLLQAEQQEIKTKFLQYLQTIEQDKLFYFVLAFNNPQKVLVVKSPSDNKKQKAFLGYEWSNAKGNEGIKLATDSQGNHSTPLYDPINRNNADKLSYWITQNFLGKEVDLTGVEGLDDLAATASLVDMLDFSRVEFNKAISLSSDAKTKLPELKNLVALSSSGITIIDGDRGSNYPKKQEFSEKGYCLFLNAGNIKNDKFTFHNCDFISKERDELLRKGKLTKEDIILTTRGTLGKVAYYHKNVSYEHIRINSGMVIFRNTGTEFDTAYIYEILRSNFVQSQIKELKTGTSQPQLPIRDINKIKIPLPDKSTQQLIVSECEQIDNDVTAAEQSINDIRKSIEELLNQKHDLKNLDEVANKISNNVNPQEQEGDVNYIGLENIESQTGQLVGEIETAYSTIKSTKTVFQENDILYGKLRPNLNKVYLAKEKGICSTDILVFRFENKELAKFYAYYLLSTKFNNEVLKTVSGQQLPRTSWTKIQTIKIPVPDLKTQQTLVTEIEKLEQQIQTAQATIDQAATKKQAVLKRYL